MAKTVTLELEVEGLAELQEALKKFPEQWPQIAGEALGPGLSVFEAKAKEDAPVGVTGQARSTIGSEVVGGAGSTIIGKTGSNLEYAPYALEYGRKPGKMPPVDVIEEWAQHVIGVAGLGFVIARAIGARGLPALRIMSKTLESKKGQALKLFEQGIDRALKRLFP